MNTNALITLWNTTQQHVGTSGARVCAEVLLSLYNGARFPMDLTDLRSLDDTLLTAAINVIRDDSTRCQREVHEWLNTLTGRRDFGERFEHLAWEYKTTRKGRCSKTYLEAKPISPARLLIQPYSPPVHEMVQTAVEPDHAPFCGIDIPPFLRKQVTDEVTA